MGGLRAGAGLPCAVQSLGSLAPAGEMMELAVLSADGEQGFCVPPSWEGCGLSLPCSDPSCFTLT